jgi:hypothetical protein
MIRIVLGAACAGTCLWICRHGGNGSDFLAAGYLFFAISFIGMEIVDRIKGISK